MCVFFFFQAEDGIRDADVTGVQTCALPIYWTSSSLNTWTADRRACTRSRLSSVIFRCVAWAVASMKCSGGRLRRYASAALSYSRRKRCLGLVVDMMKLLCAECIIWAHAGLDQPTRDAAAATHQAERCHAERCHAERLHFAGGWYTTKSGQQRFGFRYSSLFRISIF